MPENDWELVRGRRAFEENSESALLSRAAQMLTMATNAYGIPEQNAAIAEDARELGAPEVNSVRGIKSGHFSPRDQLSLDRITDRFVETAEGHSGRYPREEFDRGSEQHSDAQRSLLVQQRLWNLLDATSDDRVLMALLNYEQRHPTSELSTAVASTILSAPQLPRYDNAFASLKSLAKSNDPMVREVIGTAASPSLRRRSNADSWGTNTAHLIAGKPLSVMVHGTWARAVKKKWYHPNSELSRLIRGSATPSLYSYMDYFRWEGTYSADSRLRGGADLRDWIVKKQSKGVDTLFGHSHGGNVALNAAERGVPIELLVLMHTPASERPDAEWARIRKNVKRVFVLRTRLDLVVLADGLTSRSAQSFDHALLPHRELIRPPTKHGGWFSHDYFLHSRNWKQLDLMNEVAFERLR